MPRIKLQEEDEWEYAHLPRLSEQIAPLFKRSAVWLDLFPDLACKWDSAMDSLGKTRVRILNFISENPDSSPRKVANSFRKVPIQEVTAAVNRMMKFGYLRMSGKVARKKNVNENRCKYSVTKKGKRYLETLKDTLEM